MYRTVIDFHERVNRGEVPIVFAMIQTDLGWRLYAEKEMSKMFDVGARLADGTYTADGSITAGSDSYGVLESSPRMVSFGSFERTIQPKKADILTAFLGKQQQHISVTLDNTDRYFSQLIAQEPFITKPLVLYVGFDGDDFSKFLSLFRGTISELQISPTTMVLEADEE